MRVLDEDAALGKSQAELFAGAERGIDVDAGP